MNFPSFVLCGLSTTFSFDSDDEDSSLMDFIRENPLCCRDEQGVEAIFRESSQEDIANRDAYIEKMEHWSPPVYRNKSLNSAPSQSEETTTEGSTPPTVDVVPYDYTPSPRLGETNLLTAQAEENSTINLPKEFVPPRHTFSKSFDNDPLRLTNSDNDHKCRAGPSRSNNTSCDTSQVVQELRPHDVLCGRGMNTSLHPGNVAFKKIIKQYEMQYICSKRSDKPNLAMKLLEDFRRKSVRFVKRERDPNGRYYWIEIGDQRAYEKVCQSLREGAPQLRRQMLASQAIQERQDSNTRKNVSNSDVSPSASIRCDAVETVDHTPPRSTFPPTKPFFRQDTKDGWYEDESFFYHSNSSYPWRPPSRAGERGYFLE
mmetsp:Transcript_10063/g.18346  ORF Transcript_10063/g.18346 Transcript_10063/m.18346 type:complete len:372 (+) Transcript_10063:138-1253(+)